MSKLWIKSKSIEERFWSKVENCGDCLRWTDKLDNWGYGRLCINRIAELAHRVAWFVYYGVEPEGKLVLHNCDNTWCVRKEHLYLGTDADNMRDRTIRKRHGIDRDRTGFLKKLSVNRDKSIAVTRKMRWATDGTKTVRLRSGVKLPIGWWYGRDEIVRKNISRKMRGNHNRVIGV